MEHSTYSSILVIVDNWTCKCLARQRQLENNNRHNYIVFSQNKASRSQFNMPILIYSVVWFTCFVNVYTLFWLDPSNLFIFIAWSLLHCLPTCTLLISRQKACIFRFIATYTVAQNLIQIYGLSSRICPRIMICLRSKCNIEQFVVWFEHTITYEHCLIQQYLRPFRAYHSATAW